MCCRALFSITAPSPTPSFRIIFLQRIAQVCFLKLPHEYWRRNSSLVCQNFLTHLSNTFMCSCTFPWHIMRHRVFTYALLSVTQVCMSASLSRRFNSRTMADVPYNVLWTSYPISVQPTDFERNCRQFQILKVSEDISHQPDDVMWFFRQFTKSMFP